MEILKSNAVKKAIIFKVIAYANLHETIRTDTNSLLIFFCIGILHLIHY